MDAGKRKLLEQTYSQFLKEGTGLSDSDTLDAITDPQIMGFGTTADETILSLSQLRELVARQKEQTQGIAIEWITTPIRHYYSADENTAVFADDIRLHIGSGDEKLEMHLRFSVILVFEKDKWLVIHWHGSKPENVQSETDTFGIDDWKQKTAELEKVVAERTAQLLQQKEVLEIKNRELEIEAALEKVRSRTMAMQHSDELADASFVLDSQIRALGIQTRGCAFNIYGQNESSEWFSSEHGTLPKYKTPRENLFQRYYEAGQSGKSLHIETFAGEDCAAHYQYLCTIPIMGDALRDMVAAGGSFPEKQTDHAAYFKYGYLLFITLEPAPEAHEIFKRFANIFEQTYTRFLDLQKAEAQTLQAEQDLIALKIAREKAEVALEELKTTQRQLIQSEKMASLGELTAGIAHEIQNPLNFVNNFSDVSIELLDEMETEIENGDFEEAKAISSDIKQNLEKINHHGKRADAIVKGMLQHSRNSSGTKEPTDINALCDEYLRLSYHGLRAKDKSFNATLQTDFDPNMQNINIVSQDIGRVVLNLLTNAFYAVNEKKQTTLENYEPTVSIGTKKMGDQVEIRVGDNGNGIPQSAVDKIFQPFFTTKPTGKGTGLGLSLAYDIITKGHGGTLNVETTPQKGTQFIIQLQANP